MITISIDNIIKIGILLIQIIFYVIIFFKLHKIKSTTPLTLADLITKGKELFTKYIGTLDENAVISQITKLFKQENKPTDNEPKSEDK